MVFSNPKFNLLVKKQAMVQSSTDAPEFNSQNDATHLINLQVELNNEITDQSTMDHNGVTQ